MKTIIVAFILLFALMACRENRPPEISCVDETQYPISIEGKTKVVYQIGKMTPRGLKFYLDTLDVRGRAIQLPEYNR